MAALRLGLQWALRGDEAIFAGWFAKARRLLAVLPVGPEHGYLRYVTAMLVTDTTGMPDDAEAAASELRGMERTYGSRALGAFALVLAAHAKILRGDADAGFDLLDEAMLPVVAGEVDPFWGGDIYCTVIHLTGLIGDFGRMRAWTDALDTWSAELSQTFSYAGIVRVHQLELLVAEGRWDEAAAELGPVSSSIADTDTWVSGHGFAELGHVLRLRGRRDEAAEAYARALRAGVDPEPGPALLAAAEGRRSEGVDALRAAIASRPPVHRLALLLPAVELALDAGQHEAARGFAAELSADAGRLGAAGAQAWAWHARALLELHAARPAASADAARAAADLYRSQRLQYGLARAHDVLARAERELGRREEAAADAATALAIFRRLGATSDAARLEAATGARGVGPLTPREAQVLALVLGGASNRAIADALFLSETTVRRHLANIFTKIGVASRTAAAAWAREHGLDPVARGCTHGPLAR